MFVLPSRKKTFVIRPKFMQKQFSKFFLSVQFWSISLLFYKYFVQDSLHKQFFVYDSSHYPLGTNISSYFITSKPFSNIDLYRKVAISMVSYERYFPCLILAKKIMEKLQILIWSFFPIELSFLSKNRTKFQKIESLFRMRGVKKNKKSQKILEEIFWIFVTF